MRKLVQGIAVASASLGIATLGSAVATAQPAAAQPVQVTSAVSVAADAICVNIDDTNGNRRGRGCFFSYGDHLTAYDAYADGLWIRTDSLTDYGRDDDCEDHSSKGGAVDCNFNMDEDGRVKIQLEIWDGSKRVAETAWTGWFPIGQ